MMLGDVVETFISRQQLGINLIRGRWLCTVLLLRPNSWTC